MNKIKRLSRSACLAVTHIAPYSHHEALEAVDDLRQALNDAPCEDSEGLAVLQLCEAILNAPAAASPQSPQPDPDGVDRVVVFGRNDPAKFRRR